MREEEGEQALKLLEPVRPTIEFPPAAATPSPAIGNAETERGVAEADVPTQPARMLGFVRKIVGERGFGFIRADDRSDIFFHASCLVDGGFNELAEGQRVSFEISNAHSRPRAVNVEKLDLGFCRSFSFKAGVMRSPLNSRPLPDRDPAKRQGLAPRPLKRCWSLLVCDVVCAGSAGREHRESRLRVCRFPPGRGRAGMALAAGKVFSRLFFVEQTFTL